MASPARALRALGAARRAPAGATLVAVGVAAAAAVGLHFGTPRHVAVYLGTMALGVVVTDAAAAAPAAPLPVRRPARETTLLLAFAALGLLCGLLRTAWLPQAADVPGLVRLAIQLGALVFLLPIATAVAFALWRYTPRDVGFRAHGLLVVPALVALFAAGGAAAGAGGWLWSRVLAEAGLGGLVVQGLLAGSTEEYFRLLVQTRLGALWRSPALGWLAASLLWSVLHVPVHWKPDRPWVAVVGVFWSLPYGLLLGYVTHRTRSVVPALLVHTTNLWGLTGL